MNILLVCTGNTCRSPMAEAMLHQFVQEGNLNVQVRSAGVSAMDGAGISKHAIDALREHSIEATGMTSTPLSDQEVQWADLILTMTNGHKQVIVQYYPEALDRTYTLKEFVEDEAEVMHLINTLQAKIADWQTRIAMGEQMPEREKLILMEMQRRIPNFDISDPYGGSLEVYRACAAEIRQSLHKLVDKLHKDNRA